MSKPTKRPRTDSNAEAGGTPSKQDITKDQEAWFPDGNIDIVAEGTAFRVHRSVLSAHSELFCDMLSMPQPDNAQDTHDCPVVEVTDSADDMRHLLLALYNCNKSFLPHTAADSKVVCSLARLAHKYQVKGVLEDAMYRIKMFYPEDVGRFVQVLNGRIDNPLMVHDERDALLVLQLARLLENNSLLRPAFYYLCQLRPDDLQSNGASRDSPSAASGKDIKRCIAGRPRLASETSKARRHSLDCGAIECGSWDCMDFRNSLVELYGDETSTLCNVFRCLDLGDDVCRQCKEEIERNEKISQTTVWRRLPKIFGLKGL